MPQTSLWLWGRLRDFERDGLLEMTGAEATELRAERRAGELLAEMAESGERAREHDDRYRGSQAATLDDLGINKSQSSRW